MTRFGKIFTLIAIVALVAASFAACGSDDAVNADSDPQAVLERAFSDESAVESAKIDAVLTIEIEGDESGAIEAAVTGAVENASAQAPDTDLTLTLDGDVAGEEVDFEGGVVLTAKDGFVTLDGETYKIDPGMYEQVRGQIAQQTGDRQPGSGGLFGSLDGEAFLTDVSNEGKEEVEGVETVKISGTVDTDKALAEFEAFMNSADTLQGLGVNAPGSDQVKELRQALGDVDFSIYVGTEDGIIRKMEFSAPVDPPDSDSSGSFSISVTLADVNEPQNIAGPADAKPFDELIAAIGEGALSGIGIEGFNDLGQLGGQGSGPLDRLNELLDGSGGGGKSGPKESGGSGGAKGRVQQALKEAEEQVNKALEDSPALEQASDALDCIEKAKTVEDIQACEELVK